MCKNLIIPYIPAGKTEVARNIAKAALPVMSANDTDGVGYVEANAGDFSIKRWLNPKDAFKRNSQFSKSDKRVQEIFGEVVQVEAKYNSVGEPAETANAILMHTRMATCSVSLQNVHPFVLEDTVLIHNGVIHNHHRYEKKHSTCDSEAILTNYLEHAVAFDPKNQVQAMADSLVGYYACAVLAKDLDNRQFVDVFVGNDAQLVIGYIRELGAYAIATNRQILLSACKAHKYRLEQTYTVNDGYLIRFDVQTGDVLAKVEFDVNYRTEPIGKAYANATRYLSSIETDEKSEATELQSELDWQTKKTKVGNTYYG
jgi:glucosamine 6-phosphate synthetase-like amidotransferase/phosphosugar isomerase protein